MYVNHYDRNEKLPDENPTIGILLCANKNNEMVKLSLPKDNHSILASQYQLYLPSESQLLEEIKWNNRYLKEFLVEELIKIETRKIAEDISESIRNRISSIEAV